MNVRLGFPPARIRAATLTDAKRIAELSGQLGYPATAEEVVRRLCQLQGNSEHAVYVAEAPDGEVVAWVHVFVCHLVEEDLQAEVGGLIVDEGYRGRGVGHLLMQQVEQWARERGCWAVRLRSNVIRTGAHAFYERLGYDTVKTQKVFRKVR